MGNRFEEAAKKATAKFNAEHAAELATLKGLTKEELMRISPAVSDSKVYESLISVIQDAIVKNSSQAELKQKIVELGDIAVSIVKKIPQLAKLFI